MYVSKKALRGAQDSKYNTQDRLNMSNLIRQATFDDSKSLSMKNQLQLQLKVAEEQEQAFRLQMLEKRRRGMTVQNSAKGLDGAGPGKNQNEL